jgi:hypothetical protein
MLDETLTKLETTIRQSHAIRPDDKAELLQLLTRLHSEIATLAHTHAEQAASVSDLAERSMHEALRPAGDSQPTPSALQELSASVAELEVSHPQLVSVVNNISMLLSNIGI